MQILENFSKLNVLVIGDVILDRYWWGDVSRISPEAPVPVVRLKNTSLAAGGAANVAANVAGLGATPILVGIVGDDDGAKQFPDVLKSANVSSDHLVRDRHRPTTVKTRIVAHSQHVVRVDQEHADRISSETESAIIDKLRLEIGRVDAIAVSDYAKGMLTDKVLKDLFAIAAEHGKPVLVDPKGKDYAKYKGAALLTPNRREAAEACNFEDTGDVVNRAGTKLMDDLNLDALLVTEGEEGMTLFRRSQSSIKMGAEARQVYDVTGAGDTVIATFAVAIGAGADVETAARLANAAAGLVVEQVGTTAVTVSALEAALRKE
ncbi:MAG: D-glycero-beta-D-manno-heptose-7-phosphate kinase [Acidobacteria bacterium]|nr:MAG: D-glycero-beta-D-manno-heptose-7-phosphate kinase [Acidobacteriota bacterium]